jgi:hypothetical protein
MLSASARAQCCPSFIIPSLIISGGHSEFLSERLPDAERKVEMPGALVAKLSDLLPSHGVGRDVRVAGKVRRI